MINTLYDKFKLWSAKGSVYIISDPHFDDEDCRLMSPDWIEPEEQVKIINSLVHKNDTLICLGDVGNPKYAAMLNGYKVLIMGNHDQSVTKYKREVVDHEYSTKDYSKVDLEVFGKRYDNYYYEVTKLDEETWNLRIDNRLFDEVYSGPLFISDKILLSHEPVYGLNWCLNIHGHDHNNVENYKEDCKHINLAANLINYTPVSLGVLIKNGCLSGIQDIHRQTINRATERKNNGFSKEFVDQVRWERDIAISQLNELGLSLGEKTDYVKKCIEYYEHGYSDPYEDDRK